MVISFWLFGFTSAAKGFGQLHSQDIKLAYIDHIGHLVLGEVWIFIDEPMMEEDYDFFGTELSLVLLGEDLEDRHLLAADFL